MKIDLSTLSEDGVGLNIVLTPKQLIDVVDHIIEIAKKDLEQQAKSTPKEVYLTTQEVCDFLKVDPTTLWRWDKREYLKPIYIGGKKRYVMSEIKQRFTREEK